MKMVCPMWITAKAAVGKMIRYATIEFLRNPGGSYRFWSRLVAAAGKWYDPKIPMFLPPPRVRLEKIFPGIELENIKINMDAVFVNGEVSNHELLDICSLVKVLKPEIVFEIGTFKGQTAHHIAISYDKTLVYTLDLLAIEDLEIPLHERELSLARISTSNRDSRCFRGTPHSTRIVELFGDSLVFDFAPYKHKVNLVFIDAAHDYRHVRSDTNNALLMLAPGGVILWHDFARSPDVTQTVYEVASSHCGINSGSIFEIEGTCLAIFCSKERAINT